MQSQEGVETRKEGQWVKGCADAVTLLASQSPPPTLTPHPPHSWGSAQTHAHTLVDISLSPQTEWVWSESPAVCASHRRAGKKRCECTCWSIWLIMQRFSFKWAFSQRRPTSKLLSWQKNVCLFQLSQIGERVWKDGLKVKFRKTHRFLFYFCQQELGLHPSAVSNTAS